MVIDTVAARHTTAQATPVAEGGVSLPPTHDVICISSIDWDFMWQIHQEIMSRLAAKGYRVLFIENTGTRAPRFRDLPRIRDRWRNWRRGVYGIRQERENLFVFSPLVIPLPYSRVAAWINRQILMFIVRRWAKATGFARPIVWTFLPTRLTLDLLSHIDHDLLIYYCVDRFTAASSSARKISGAERQLLRRADLVFVTSQALAGYCTQFTSQVYCFPAGVDLQLFDPTKELPMPEELRHLRRPLIGYVGGIHQWLDLELLHTIARERTEYSFVMVGPVQTEIGRLKDLPNVVWVGQRSHRELASYIRAFDAGIIPYRLTEYTRHVYPSKLNEYLAMGKPVVSTALPEIQAFNERCGPLVYVGRDAAEFRQALDKALRDRNGEITLQRHRAVEANDWDARVQQIAALIHGAIQEKWSRQGQQWRQVFVDLARRSRRRAANILWPILIGYLVLFHTPAIWWMAEPLRVAEAPHPCDAIVAFAGGVGESGQAGQGYEERVEYAVSLYRQGYAPVLFFSSGFHYAFAEAQLMKTLAVSLRVPPAAIILEELASNTHDNVRFSAAFLRSRGYRSALVVSSPYNMRRATLVWRKEAPDIAATWVPIPYSHFFGDHRRVALKHLLAILHEYLGILYYWWKGWV